MKFLYCVESARELKPYRDFAEKYQTEMDHYLTYLSEKYAAKDLPNAVILTSREIATKTISSIPVPAYTNANRTVFCPDLTCWQDIYLKQLSHYPDSPETDAVRRYYETALSERNVLQILGHEYVHHSNFFPDSDYESGIWFEEGMAEYISRRYFLTEEQFYQELHCNQRLISLYEKAFGKSNLEDFGRKTYLGDFSGIFYGYWRSFLAVHKLVAQIGSIAAVFQAYHGYLASGTALSLSDYFSIS